MRVPTSVLLAILAAAGLLALAPALVRRYDAAERLVAERAESTARVLQRRRRRRTVPGRRPVNPARYLVAKPVSGAPAGTSSSSSFSGGVGRGGASAAAGARRAGASSSIPSGAGRRAAAVAGLRTAAGVGRRLGALRAVPRDGSARRPRRHTPAVYRRRRVFAALLLLNLAELVGVILVSPGFWIGFAVTGTLLTVYVVHLRNRAMADRRRRRAEAREAAWLAARQAEVRREQARRAAARREAQRRLAAQREAVRRAAMGLDRVDLPAAAAGGGSGSDGPLGGGGPLAGGGSPGGGVRRAGGARSAGSVSYRRSGGLRGRPYEAGRGSHSA
ncbi:hypothetical protein [Plantactinospora sp. GCM10030261]|uniref:hypothetical protein n=1 Tax=Plantactinospora sp. GCM10030261 TaxID=3273420 RepID=UPI00360F64EB